MAPFLRAIDSFDTIPWVTTEEGAVREGDGAGLTRLLTVVEWSVLAGAAGGVTKLKKRPRHRETFFVGEGGGEEDDEEDEEEGPGTGGKSAGVLTVAGRKVRVRPVALADCFEGDPGKRLNLIGIRETNTVIGYYEAGAPEAPAPVKFPLDMPVREEYVLGAYLAGVEDMRVLSSDAAMTDWFAFYPNWDVFADKAGVQQMLRTGKFSGFMLTAEDSCNPACVELSKMVSTWNHRVAICKTMWGSHPLEAPWASVTDASLRAWHGTAVTQLTLKGWPSELVRLRASAFVMESIGVAHEAWEQDAFRVLKQVVADKRRAAPIARPTAAVAPGAEHEVRAGVISVRGVTGLMNLGTVLSSLSLSFLTAAPTYTEEAGQAFRAAMLESGFLAGISKSLQGGSSVKAGGLSQHTPGSSAPGRLGNRGGRGGARGASSRGGLGGVRSVMKWASQAGVAAPPPSLVSAVTLGGGQAASAAVSAPSRVVTGGALVLPSAGGLVLVDGQPWPFQVKEAQSAGGRRELPAFADVVKRFPEVAGATLNGKAICVMSLVYKRNCTKASSGDCRRVHVDLETDVIKALPVPPSPSPQGTGE